MSAVWSPREDAEGARSEIAGAPARGEAGPVSAAVLAAASDEGILLTARELVVLVVLVVVILWLFNQLRRAAGGR